MADINDFMKWMLRSPIHSLASKHTMLITFTGRRTGQRYTTPVRYFYDVHGNIIIFARKHAGWWKNLLEKPEVTLRIQGEDLAGTVIGLVDDPAQVAAGAALKYGDRHDDKTAAFAADRVMVTIQLKQAARAA